MDGPENPAVNGYEPEEPNTEELPSCGKPNCARIGIAASSLPEGVVPCRRCILPDESDETE